MASITGVLQYITDNILYSKAWEDADNAKRQKAVNNAEKILRRLLPDYYPGTIVVPTEDLAFQTIWLLRLDDTIQRAEQGVTSVSIDGITINMADRDRTIAPIILKDKGIDPNDPKALIKRRVGSYNVSALDTRRMGIGRMGGVR